MAQVIGGTTELEETIIKLKDESYQYVMIIGGTFMLTIAFHFLFDAIIILNLSFLVLSLMCYKVYQNIQQIKIYNTGLNGELKTTELLTQLPDNYTVFTDVKVEFEGKESQLDYVIVGHNGVFVLENKNWNGVVEGNDTEQKISQHKTGKNGGKYTATHYNPARQVTTHVVRLSGYLKGFGIHTWVHGMVLFSHPEVTVNLISQKAKIFTLEDMHNGIFNREVMNAKGKQLTNTQIKQIIRVLSGQEVNA